MSKPDVPDQPEADAVPAADTLPAADTGDAIEATDRVPTTAPAGGDTDANGVQQQAPDEDVAPDQPDDAAVQADTPGDEPSQGEESPQDDASMGDPGSDSPRDAQPQVPSPQVLSQEGQPETGPGTVGPVTSGPDAATAAGATAAGAGVPLSRQRPGTSASEAETTTPRLRVAHPVHSRHAEQPKANPQPTGQTYGYWPGSAPPSQAAPRYGRNVAQPFNSQPSHAADQSFSQPTVRIGGRVQPEPTSSPPPSTSTRARPTRIPRRTSLQLRYLEPWSVLKVALVLSVAGFLAWMVAVGVLYSVLAGMGVWDQLNGTYSDLTSVNNGQAGDELISAGGVFGVAAVIGMVNIVLITAMCAVGAFIYNASADLAGGIEITLSERD